MGEKKHLLALSAAIAVLSVHAVPTSAEQAARAVDKWLVDNPALGCRLGTSTAGARTLETAVGARFHVVRLRGGGFVIVSGDTSVEPIIAFSSSNDLAESTDNPLYRLLDRDLSRRPLRSLKFAAAPGAVGNMIHSSEESKWATLLGDEETDPSVPQKVLKMALGKNSVSDCRVAPLLSTQWSQTGPKNLISESALCYNYFTPNNWPCGCVATACAQIMYYHRQPAAAYNWSAMVEKPAKGISDAGAQAIGRLTADIGQLCGAVYGPGGTSTPGYMIAPLLTGYYGYGSAIAFQTRGGIPAGDFMSAIIPNLDAKLPVALGLGDSYGYGHEVVADGYGYDYGTFYLHVNLGWAGLNDAWYAPPDIEDYEFIDGIVCNIDPQGSSGKTLVSGRVLNAKTGTPVAGANVSAGGVTSVTDARGIYALALTPGSQQIVAVASGSSVSVNVNVPANVGVQVDFSTGMYYLLPTLVANRYGVDLALDAEKGESVEPPSPEPEPEPSPEPESEPSPEPEPEPDPVFEPDPEVETAVDFVPPTEPFAAPVATTMSGVVLAEDGSVAGVVQLKVGKASKKGESKVSLTLTGKDGKKLTAKAVSVQVGKGLQTVTFDIKNYGTLKLRLGADGFIGKSGAGGMIGTVDDEPATGPAAVALTLDEELPFADVLTEYLPTDITVERTAKKWTLPKAGKLKYVKANPKKGIEAGLVATGENIAGLKLTYTPKTQTVKGSFKIWTFDEAKGKLKSVSASVTGVVVGGVAYCDVTYKKQQIGELTVR